MRLCVIGGAALVAALAGCSSSATGPAGSPIIFASGDHQTDTILAQLSQPLIVKIGIAPRGQSVAHQVVQFATVTDSNRVEATPAFAAETTDASGEVRDTIQLGSRAGPARLAVLVPAFNYVDTARFTVLPGHSATIVESPADTAVFVGGTVKMNSVAVDQGGNRLSTPVSYSVATGPATVSGSTVTATGIGRIAVAASAQGAVNTTYISAVPPGVIAGVSDSGGIVMFNLDGTGYKRLTPMSTVVGSLRWAPNGNSLVFDGTQGGNGLPFMNWGTTLQTVQLNGAVSTLVSRPGGQVAWPAYSPDGSYIYYVDASQNQIRRVHPDGTGDTLLVQNTATYEQFPSVSPDGTSLMYVESGSGAIDVVTLSTGTTTTLPIVGISTFWSPTSNTIAYINPGGQIAKMNADGSGSVVLTSQVYWNRLDWSPDGNWIIGQEAISYRLDIVNVTTGMLLPIPSPRTMGSPTWH